MGSSATAPSGLYNMGTSATVANVSAHANSVGLKNSLNSAKLISVETSTGTSSTGVGAPRAVREEWSYVPTEAADLSFPPWGISIERFPLFLLPRTSALSLAWNGNGIAEKNKKEGYKIKYNTTC